ncbi:cytochrome P450 monooxygenase [Mycena capillaripes]|nr:cytochrome P450 monooxygenase [Mycena capillaripes]
MILFILNLDASKVVSTFLLVLCCLYLPVSYLYDPYGIRKYPGPLLAKFTYAWILWVGITRRRSEKIHEAHKKYGSIVRISPSEVSFSHPAAYSEVHSFNNKVTKSSFYDAFASIGLTNVFTTRSKSEHGQKRKLLHPLFTTQVAREFAPQTSSIISDLLDQWETRYVPENSNSCIWFDCVPWISMLAFDAIGAFIFGETFGMISSASDRVSVPKDWRLAFNHRSLPENYPLRDISLIHTVSTRETYNYLVGLLPSWWKGIGRGVLRNQVQASRVFSGFVAHRVVQRLSATESHSGVRCDLVGRFLHRAATQNEPFQPESLIAELITILVAGSDTTRNSLIAAIYYITRSTNVQYRLQEELDTHMAANATTFPDVEELPFLGACLNETLRLYSPVAIGLPRTVPESGIRVSGEYFAGGTTVGVPIYTIHRDKSVWGSDAEEFKPERWLQDNTSKTKFMDAFKPFSDGPAGCIGKHLALAQLRVMIAAVFKRFDVVLEDPTRSLLIDDWFVRRVRECRIGLRPRK